MATGTILNIGYESGNDGNGNYYAKYPDGTLICWGIFSIAQSTWSSPTASGAFYDTHCDPSVTFAHAFYSVPSVSATSKLQTIATVVVNPTATALNYLAVWRHTSSKPATGDWQYIAIGRWKA